MAFLAVKIPFDEDTLACLPTFGRYLMSFIGKKPTRKLHFKQYILYCASIITHA
jgi:hypothetical protein